MGMVIMTRLWLCGEMNAKLSLLRQDILRIWDEVDDGKVPSNSFSDGGS